MYCPQRVSDMMTGGSAFPEEKILRRLFKASSAEKYAPSKPFLETSFVSQLPKHRRELRL